jgi:hypothetical protein
MPGHKHASTQHPHFGRSGNYLAVDNWAARVLDIDILSGAAPGGRPGSRVAEHLMVTCAPRAGPVATVRISAQRARPRERGCATPARSLCTKHRVTVCDLGVLVIEAAEPVSPHNAPCHAVVGASTSAVYDRYIGGPSARIISPLPRYRTPAPVLAEITDRLHRHPSPGPGFPLSRSLRQVRC